MANQDAHIDRISDLPSDVIDGILQYLNIRDQVRTSILSTKWRKTWTSVPQIEFDSGFFNRCFYRDYPGHVVFKIITNVLMLHTGPIYKFCLCTPLYYKFKNAMQHINMWIPRLSRRGLKYLELVNSTPASDRMPYIVFSCEELVYFKLCGFNLSIPPNFSGFKRLLELDLEYVTLDSRALESLISGCPLLEKLSIVSSDGFEYLDISSPTLKVLWLDFRQNVKSVWLEKAENLIDLKLVALNSWVSGIIKSLPKKIERFSIGTFFSNQILDYAANIPPTLLKRSFSSIKYLKLGDVKWDDRGEVLYIVRVLESAPCLVELVVQSYSGVDITQAPDCSEELECSSCCLNQLQTVNICTLAASRQYAMRLIRFLLANSTSLKTLTFDIRLDYLKLEAPLLSIYQELLSMKKASPRAQVKFFY